MFKKTAFAQCISENEIQLKNTYDNIYQTAHTVLVSQPLYQYFEKYLGGYLIIMDPDGTIFSSKDSENFKVPQAIGYIHPLDREKYINGATEKAKSLLDTDHTRSYDALSGLAGAIKLKSGLVFSYSGFEFLELKDSNECDSYEDIFETINLYTALTSDFFQSKSVFEFTPHRFSFDSRKESSQDVIREEILYSLTQEELIDIATKISTTGLQYNFSLLNEVFLAKVLFETGFVDMDFVEKIITEANRGFSPT